jgi:hypothetical protein
VTAQTVLSAVIVVTRLTSAVIIVPWGGRRVEGPLPLSLLGFMTLLFTSGFDVGLIVLPLTEFPLYAREPVYAFANPLAIDVRPAREGRNELPDHALLYFGSRSRCLLMCGLRSQLRQITRCALLRPVPLH